MSGIAQQSAVPWRDLHAPSTSGEKDLTRPSFLAYEHLTRF